jgi:hypothetical protein
LVFFVAEWREPPGKHWKLLQQTGGLAAFR